MDPQLAQIRDQQRQTWDKFSPGWKKWDEFLLKWVTSVGDELIRSARLRDTSHLLDVAAGTGEPGLTAAGIITRGKVTVTDLSDRMLEVAAEKAARRGIKNLETRQCDVTALPFSDGTFDAVTCRFGFMFFPDINVALGEMVRVSKPGARICAAVWGAPEKNAWATTIMSTIAKNVEMPPPPPGAPGLFRCATPDLMASAYRKAGLKNIVEKEVVGEAEFQTPEQYWNFMTEIAAPVVAGLAKADDRTRDVIRQTVLELTRKTSQDGNVKFRWSALAICGEK